MGDIDEVESENGEGKVSFTMKLEKDIRKEIDKLIEKRRYFSRAEFVRKAIIEKLKKEGDGDKYLEIYPDYDTRRRKEEDKKELQDMVDAAIEKRRRELFGENPKK